MLSQHATQMWYASLTPEKSRGQSTCRVTQDNRQRGSQPGVRRVRINGEVYVEAIVSSSDETCWPSANSRRCRSRGLCSGVQRPTERPLRRTIKNRKLACQYCYTRIARYAEATKATDRNRFFYITRSCSVFRCPRFPSRSDCRTNALAKRIGARSKSGSGSILPRRFDLRRGSRNIGSIRGCNRAAATTSARRTEKEVPR